MKNKYQIDICVIGEGESTLSDIIETYMSNGRKKLCHDELLQINGIAFLDNAKFNNDAKIKLKVLKNTHSSTRS